jgi:hypothetical protein
MHEQVIAFIAALRAAGVRVSLAESVDALRAILQAGLDERGLLRAALRVSLIKERADQPTFDRLFPAFFGGDGVALVPPADGALSPDERAQLELALEAALAESGQPALALLFAAMVGGGPLSQEQTAALLDGVAPLGTSNPGFQPWLARRVLRELQFERLAGTLHELLERLRAAGLPDDTLRALGRSAEANRTALAEQVSRAVARQMLRQSAGGRPRARPLDELLDRPIHLLSAQEVEELRAAVARLAARLRTRVARRRQVARRGPPDPRATLRASLRYGGVPFALRRRRRRRSPRLVILCDLSSSMRATAGFMLLLIYALHDQVRRTRSFAYIDDLHDISADFVDARPAPAIAGILGRLRADYARTDLGHSLDRFVREQLGAVDRRTTVLILGDGRNNRADPGLDQLRQIKARARRLIWLTPETQRAWGSGDSDMPAYAALCHAVHVVRTLRDLSDAVEKLLTEQPL